MAFRCVSFSPRLRFRTVSLTYYPRDDGKLLLPSNFSSTRAIQFLRGNLKKPFHFNNGSTMLVLCVLMLTASYFGNGNSKETNLTETKSWRIDIELHNPNSKSFTLNTFLTTLFQINEKQIDNTLRNILKNYRLQNPEVGLLTKEFEFSITELKYIIVHKVKDKTNTTHYEETDKFMLGLMEYSNRILQYIIANNLDRVGGKLLELTEWQEQSLRDKILRQQSKIVVDAVERNICETFSLCYDKIYYTEYLTDWLTVLLNSNSHTLKLFFDAVSQFLDDNVVKVKTSNKFRQIAREFVTVNSESQRDMIDFFHEVITNHNKTFDKVPLSLKQYAILISELFSLVDNNYDLNIENLKVLKRINKDFLQWAKKGNLNLKTIINVALDNMLLNIKIWPLHAQSKIDFTWLKIIF